MWPIQLAFLLFVVLRTFLSSLTLCNTPSFFTRLIQMIFSSLYQHHISRLSRYIWSVFCSVLVWSAHKATLKRSTRLVSSLNLSAICRWTKSFHLNCKEVNCLSTLHIITTGCSEYRFVFLSLVECCCSHDSPKLNFMCTQEDDD